MDRPRLYVDFNEMLDEDLVLLSKGDVKADSSGADIDLHAGMRVHIYMDDVDENGVEDPLIADGVVEAAPRTGWSAAAKWCCRIDTKGIRRLPKQ